MEKWKIAVIILLFGALGGYGWYQQNAAQAPAASDQAGTQQTPASNTKLNAMMNQAPPAWNIPANLWVNSAKPIPLASLKGNVALVEFWRIGCHHCEASVPFLNALYKKYSSRGVKMVTIHSPGAPVPENPETNWNTVKQKIKEWGIIYPVAYDAGGKLFREEYGGNTFPTLIVLDRAGRIVFITTGHTPEKEKELAATIEKTLQAK